MDIVSSAWVTVTANEITDNVAGIGPDQHGASPGLDISTHLARHGLKMTVQNADGKNETIIFNGGSGGDETTALTAAYVALLSYHMDGDEFAGLRKRINLAGTTGAIVENAWALRRHIAELVGGARASRIYHILQPYMVEAIVVALLQLIPVVGCLTPLIWIINIIYAIKANKGVNVEIPVITSFAKGQNWM